MGFNKHSKLMKISMSLLVFVILSLTTSGAILEVKSDNYLDFSKKLSSQRKQRTMIFFSDKKPLCPECHTYLMKDFFKLSDYLSSNNKTEINLVHIDCAYEFLICRKFHVQRFPHIAYIDEDGDVYVMQGDEALITY